MTEQVETIQDHSASKMVKRRGILAAAGAVVAGMVAKQTSQPVEASPTALLFSPDLNISSINDAGGRTVLSAKAGWTDTLPVFQAFTNSGASLAAISGAQGTSDALFGSLPSCGIHGYSDTQIGTMGHSSSGTGVFGFVGSPNISQFTNVGIGGQNDRPFGIGVQGSSSSYFGVQGLTTSGIAVRGNVQTGGAGTSNIGVLGQVGGDGSFPSSQPNTFGVYGQNLSTGANGIGVLGQSDLAGSTGVKGISGAGFPIIGNIIGTGSAINTAAGVLGAGTKGPGVQGQSPSGHGLVGTTDATDGHAGLIGNATHVGGIGLMGIAPGYGTPTVGLAGDFFGNVKINGGTLLAPVMQAVVKHQGDNSHRLLHTMASPEGWLEDFGTGTLAADKAEITLDHDFAALIQGDYHVFLTPNGPQHLHVSQKSATGFTVMAMAWAAAAGGPKPAVGGGSFSWRVVGKRRDVSGERLAKVAAPTAPNRPTAFTIPETPAVKPPTKQP